MMLYLTGATSSVKKSEDVAQTDVSKSLGGYISSSSVPNGSLNTLFDAVSLKTIKDKQKETICIGLVNKLDQSVKNVTLKIVSAQDGICRFKVAAVLADKNLCVEHISNRYGEPINAEFYDVTFYRASVDVEILRCAVPGESISFDPFDVIVDIEEGGYEGNWKAINKAFSNDETYCVKRLTETKFRIERKDDKTIEEPSPCSVIVTENAKLSFSGDFKNVKANEVLITEELASGDGIGIWLQREVSNFVEKSNEELIQDYDDKREVETVENVEMVIDYELAYDGKACVIDAGDADDTFTNTINIDCGKS